MHPENIYGKQPLEVDRLAESTPTINRSGLVDSDRTFVDFKDPEQLRQLTCALLVRDFNLKLSLPYDRLCPIIPGRLDYCLWLIDVLKASIELTLEGDRVLVIDIGTGSSAIYPLLLSRLLKSAQMIATEVDQSSYDSAVRNITQNDLADRIFLQKTSSTDPSILPIGLITQNTSQRISITMCNPPFYNSQEEIEALRQKKDAPPEGACTGSEVEMIYPGGEVGFIEKMMRDSLIIGSQTRWFTCLCGKYTTLFPVVQLFKSLGGNNYAISELIQGRTRRWVIGWSWQHHRLPDDVARTMGPPGPRLKDCSQFLPPSNHLEYYMPLDVIVFGNRKTLADQITNTLELVEKSHFEQFHSDASCSWKVTLYEKNWTRNARRKRKFAAAEASGPQTTTQDTRPGKRENGSDAVQLSDRNPILEVRLSLNAYHPTPRPEDRQVAKDESRIPLLKLYSSPSVIRPTEEQIGVKISSDWLFGQDRDLFLSFWNHVLKMKSVATT
ncbi:hypothetical protein PCANC_03774 [Puccinia coronata f. sp. avenae]|uniref:U6 small nuclear RNA (adenine-(43)-N(6))-methyltransferase n=1 Tax=Puccinia coronata f. sp. avenae TaxID=200324 RepID=A0A2N5SVG3_9BASI|nr:hypothetical protein PCASD_16496 [Puccinia coronata f. sp. avenae]PLW53935.1 hypothetical protein PCANC_03774 [Puccinia coronata f. sp. avenae]